SDFSPSYLRQDLLQRHDRAAGNAENLPTGRETPYLARESPCAAPDANIRPIASREDDGSRSAPSIWRAPDEHHGPGARDPARDWGRCKTRYERLRATRHHRQMNPTVACTVCYGYYHIRLIPLRQAVHPRRSKFSGSSSPAA